MASCKTFVNSLSCTESYFKGLVARRSIHFLLCALKLRRARFQTSGDGSGFDREASSTVLAKILSHLERQDILPFKKKRVTCVYLNRFRVSKTYQDSGRGIVLDSSANSLARSSSLLSRTWRDSIGLL